MHFNRTRASLCVIALTLSGCVVPSDFTVPNPESSINQNKESLSDRPSDGHEGDEYLFDIAREVPSYGGHSQTRNGDFIVLSTNPEDFEAVRRAVRSRIANGRIFTNSKLPPEIKAVQGDFTIRQLAVWRDSLFRARRSLNWFLLDLDEGRNRVTLVLAKDGEYTRESAFGREIVRLGVPFEAVNVEAIGAPEDARSISALRQTATNLGQSADTLVGGLRIVSQAPTPTGWGACSIGYPILRQSGQFGFLSASHCSLTKFGSDGSLVLQPDGQPIGAEVYDMPPGNCPWLWPCNKYRFSDANVYSVDTVLRKVKVGFLAKPSTRGYIMSGDTTLASNSYIQVVGETSSITQGSIMDQMGATHGWTAGEITNTCADFYSDFGLVRCTYTMYSDAHGGDSGGPVFYYNSANNTATATGILIARNSSAIVPRALFSKFMYVRNEISAGIGGFSILSGSNPPPVPTASIIGVSSMKPSASCYWYVSSGIQYSSVNWYVNGVSVGANFDLTHTASSSFLLEVEVTDGTQFASASRNITVSAEAGTCYIE